MSLIHWNFPSRYNIIQNRWAKQLVGFTIIHQNRFAKSEIKQSCSNLKNSISVVISLFQQESGNSLKTVRCCWMQLTEFLLKICFLHQFQMASSSIDIELGLSLYKSRVWRQLHGPVITVSYIHVWRPTKEYSTQTRASSILGGMGQLGPDLNP